MIDKQSDKSYQHVRILRKEKKMSLTELAERSGLSISFLSNYENGKVNISVASLKRISAAMGIPVSHLLTDDQSSEVNVVRVNNRYVLPHHRTASGMAMVEYLTRSNKNAMHVTVTKLPPRSETGDYTAHAGEEFIYTLRGKATVLINDVKYVLEPGDFIYYASETLHKVLNEHDEEVEYLQSNTPPTF
ncbi:MAG: XRE family transcriptional regulator [Bacillota bacterium]